MRLLLLAFLASYQLFGACAATWANGYSKCVEIVLDHTKIVNTDDTDFTNIICFNGSGCGATFTNADMKVTGSGGSVTRTDCFDCIITSDNAGTTLLKWQTPVYFSTTGEVVFKVKLTRSHTADDKVYLFYGNASTTTFQGGAVGTNYAALYSAAYDFGDGTTLNVTDWSAKGLNLTNTSSVAGAGMIGGAIVTSATHFANTTTSVALSGQAWTICAWEKTSAAGSQNMIVDVGTDTGAAQMYMQLLTTNNFSTGDGGGGSGRANGTSTTNADGNWHFGCGTHGSEFKIYVDGVFENNGGGFQVGPSLDGLWVGRRFNGTLQLVGSIDEVLVYNATMTADQVAHLYANQGNISSFYSFSAPVSQASSVVHKVRAII